MMPSFRFRIWNLQSVTRYFFGIRPTTTRCVSFSTHLQSKIIQDVLQTWQKTLHNSKLSEPDVSVEYVIAHTLGKKTLYNTDLEDELTESQITQVNKMCKLCQTGMPVQYVLGEWDFHDLTVKLRPPVLIPRPETEELANFCITTLQTMDKENSVKILEIGSGSGALTVCLLKRFKQLEAVALDISQEACYLTTENATAYGVQDRLTVIHGDFNKEQVIKELKNRGPYSLLISNPPYVRTAEMDDLQPEIKWFEDPQALHGGNDGLDLIKVILKQASQLLVPKGHIWLEVGLGHPEEIQRFVSKDSQYLALQYVETALDFTGRGRFCHLTKVESSVCLER